MIFIKYQNKRAKLVEAWWNLVNLEDVLKRFEDSVGLIDARE
jgi:Superoxide dismutase